MLSQLARSAKTDFETEGSVRNFATAQSMVKMKFLQVSMDLLSVSTFKLFQSPTAQTDKQNL